MKVDMHTWDIIHHPLQGEVGKAYAIGVIASMSYPDRWAARSSCGGVISHANRHPAFAAVVRGGDDEKFMFRMVNPRPVVQCDLETLHVAADAVLARKLDGFRRVYGSGDNQHGDVMKRYVVRQ